MAQTVVFLDGNLLHRKVGGRGGDQRRAESSQRLHQRASPCLPAFFLFLFFFFSCCSPFGLLVQLTSAGPAGEGLMETRPLQPQGQPGGSRLEPPCQESDHRGWTWRPTQSPHTGACCSNPSGFIHVFKKILLWEPIHWLCSQSSCCTDQPTLTSPSCQGGGGGGGGEEMID